MGREVVPPAFGRREHGPEKPYEGDGRKGRMFAIFGALLLGLFVLCLVDENVRDRAERLARFVYPGGDAPDTTTAGEFELGDPEYVEPTCWTLDWPEDVYDLYWSADPSRGWTLVVRYYRVHRVPTGYGPDVPAWVVLWHPDGTPVVGGELLGVSAGTPLERRRAQRASVRGRAQGERSQGAPKRAPGAPSDTSRLDGPWARYACSDSALDRGWADRGF